MSSNEQEPASSPSPDPSEIEDTSSSSSQDSEEEKTLSDFDDCDAPLSERSSLSEHSDVQEFSTEDVPFTNMSMLNDPNEPYVHVFENLVQPAPPDPGAEGWETNLETAAENVDDNEQVRFPDFLVLHSTFVAQQWPSP